MCSRVDCAGAAGGVVHTSVVAKGVNPGAGDLSGRMSNWLL